MVSSFRLTTTFAFGALALAAHASVRYDFVGNFDRFALTLPDFVTSSTTVSASAIPFGYFGRVGAGTGTITSVVFTPAVDLLSGQGVHDEVRVNGSYANGTPGSTAYYFPLGSFASFGTRSQNIGLPASLTVDAQPVPEPTLLAGLGLGILPFLRGHKRA